MNLFPYRFYYCFNTMLLSYKEDFVVMISGMEMIILIYKILFLPHGPGKEQEELR